jgi:O-antigen ligase
MRRFGLADGLGIVAALTAVMYLPGLVDPLTYPKLLVLAAGGLALAPAVYLRWRKGSGATWPSLVVCGAALGIVVWGLVSLIGSGAPWAVSLFGWWGRGDGWLAWLGAVILLLGAATLNRDEVARTITWLLGGATIVAFIGILQAAGVAFPEGGVGGSVTGLMGNTNFASGYFAILGVLALGRALTQAVVWQRIWGGVLFVILGALAVLTEAQQGPVALAAGLVAFGVAYALLYRGRWRVPGLIAAGAVVALGAALLIASSFAVGPLARLWSESTFDIRQEYWQSAWNIMNGVPIFGTGPDSFARFVGEYRPESYVELLGPVLRVSAAHNVALQFGAVLGWLGLVLWIVTFVGALLLLLVRIVRAPVVSIALTASVFGALVAYFIQGMVSIDMLPLLATGWLVAGLAVAAAREPLPKAASEETPAPQTRKAKAKSVSRSPVALDGPMTPVWVPVTGGVLALGAVILVGAQIGAAGAVQNLNSQEAAVGFVTNPLSPCPLRIQTTQQLIQQVPADVSVPTTYDALAVDPRCAPMINFASDLAIQSGELERADSLTLEGIEFDPLLDLSWILRARYLLAAGDVNGAQAALDEAVRVQSLYPETSEKTPTADLQAEIDAARG